ncbi:MAG: TlpA disulfide reductase family protein [Bacteroidia bacterium]
MLQTLLLFTGLWRATLALPDAELPFNFEIKNVQNKIVIEIINGEERIVVDEVTTKDDSIFFKMPVFDSEVKAYTINGLMRGVYINHARKTNPEIPFEARYGETNRFIAKYPASKPANFNGRWAVNFSEGTADSSYAVGIFNQKGNYLSGTFLTETGDYRYLEGLVDRDSLFLSCFDGSHAFLFKAELSNGKIKGMYYSGNHWKEPWIAMRDEKAELPDAYSITYMKPGYDKFDFRFPDLDSNMVSFSDKRFKGKVTVIQIMGSWCPNCLDETIFLAPFYEKHKDKKFQIIGLAFEKTNDFKKSVSNVKRLSARYNVQYPILIAGTSNKEDAAKALPMLNKITGYPTTIIIDKKGNVRRIHTGFTGPATGKYYDRFVEEFTLMIEKLERE